MAYIALFILTIAVLVTIAVLADRGKVKQLRAAPAGAVRVESVKGTSVDVTVKKYADAGWSVTDQTSAKSFGSQARVTLTFRKS